MQNYTTLLINDMLELGEFHNAHKWGYEIWIVNNGHYCGKLLVLENQEKSSYHYHADKIETFICLSGEVAIKKFPFYNRPAAIIEDRILKLGDKITMYRGEIHQFNAVSENAVILEISTHHEDDDTYRMTSCI